MIQNVGNSIEQEYTKIVASLPARFSMSEDESEQGSLQTIAIFCGIGLLLTLWAVELDRYSAVAWF